MKVVMKPDKSVIDNKYILSYFFFDSFPPLYSHIWNVRPHTPLFLEKHQEFVAKFTKLRFGKSRVLQLFGRISQQKRKKNSKRTDGYSQILVWLQNFVSKNKKLKKLGI